MSYYDEDELLELSKNQMGPGSKERYAKLIQAKVVEKPLDFSIKGPYYFLGKQRQFYTLEEVKAMLKYVPEILPKEVKEMALMAKSTGRYYQINRKIEKNLLVSFLNSNQLDTSMYQLPQAGKRRHLRRWGSVDHVAQSFCPILQTKDVIRHKAKEKEEQSQQKYKNQKRFPMNKSTIIDLKKIAQREIYKSSLMLPQSQSKKPK